MKQRVLRLISRAEEDGTAVVGCVCQIGLVIILFIILGVVLPSAPISVLLTMLCSFSCTYAVMIKFRNDGYEWSVRRPRFLEGFALTHVVFLVVVVIGLLVWSHFDDGYE